MVTVSHKVFMVTRNVINQASSAPSLYIGETSDSQVTAKQGHLCYGSQMLDVEARDQFIYFKKGIHETW